jgi:PKD repeat protein
MAGEAAEYYMNGTNDFLVGAQIFKANGALRYMCNPTQDHISIDNAADMPRGGMNNHYSSGVYNKAFCLLATTAGWNTKTAFQAFARANRDYWGPSSTWNQAACGVQRAASDMGMNVSQVVAAFAGVGVTAEGTNCGGGGGNTPPVASFTFKTRGMFVQVTDTSTDSDGTIVSRSWDSGDGRSSTKSPLLYRYRTAGTYTVTLTVTDDDGATSSTSHTVTVP